MGKLYGSISGIVGGLIVGFVLALGVEIITCSDSATAGIMIMSPIIGFFAGLIWGESLDEADREDERKRKEEEKKSVFTNWDKNLQEKIGQIQRNIGENADIIALYKNLFAIKEKIEVDTTLENEHEKQGYIERFDLRVYQHKERMETWIKNHLSANMITRRSLMLVFDELKFLKVLNQGEERYDEAIAKLDIIIKNTKFETDFCKEINYGEWMVPLEENEMEVMKGTLDEYRNGIINTYNKISDIGDGYFKNIAEYLPDDIVQQCAKLMWYYAKKIPFDVNGFKQAVKLYNNFTVRFYDKEQLYHRKIEAVIARLYAFNLMGGENAVEQEKQDVINWVSKSISIGEGKKCILLASALCWMELYKFEKEILETLVKNGVQLTAELQERYGFLVEGGESSKAKVYDVESSDTFMYDSSASEWAVKDFDMFFRKLSMKKKNINYSLAISKWKTTLPLVSGQKVSKEELHNEFMKLIDDYDGELTCRKVNSKAVNLSNIENEQAELFEFVGERNKCISILFIAEKYGRNLNLTILTLFTPAEDLSNEELKKYAMSIKDNMYVDSFIESIRQAVDEVIKEKQDIYGTSTDGSQEQDGAKEKIIKVFE